jgi:hypothetical protein
MTSRGSRLKKLAPRSDSKDSTAAMRRREAPSPTTSPTFAPSALASRSSSHSSPAGRNARRRRVRLVEPRRDADRAAQRVAVFDHLDAGQLGPSPRLAMLVKVATPPTQAAPVASAR